MKKNWFCAQIGAREHYAVPRVLQKAGKLAALYTDFWAGSLIRIAAGKTKVKHLRSLAHRFHPQLADAPVFSWNARSLMWEASLRKSRDVYSGFTEIGNRFAVRVRDALKQRNDLGPDSIFFSYDTGALEAMEWCRGRGVRCVLNQMDPGRLEVELVRQEEKLWPGWAIQPLEVPETYFKRREKESAAADRIVVNSDFCQEQLVKQGIPPDKVIVIPLCFEPMLPDPRLPLSNRPLRVLFLGQIILRKGIQYLMQAARLLEDENIQFDIVGPMGISADATTSAPRNMAFHGRTTRDQTVDWYRRSDVFVLPTLSDGFAITQLEAMSYGLPVVATPCCGEVVTNGVDGFIVPPRNADALAEILRRYLAEPELLRHQQEAALVKIKHFSLDRIRTGLNSLENHLCGTK
ncbi:MAG TPA: glycosyltransferase family 4 protein [Verrucomicrobiae bacterium]